MNKENETIEVRPVIGYEGLYEVTSKGEVYSLNYNNTGKRVVMKSSEHSMGYLVVNLCKKGKAKLYFIHRLVAEAFLPNPDGKAEIDHINAIKFDNRIENLRWCTSKENKHNPISKVEHKRATSKANVKRFAKAVYCLELDKVFESAREAARQLGLDSGSISRCCSGRYKATRGYHFRFHIQV